MKNNNWVYDVEQAKNLHSFTGMQLHTKDVIRFVIHPDWNQRREYKKFLDTKPTLIGFNNLFYDYPVVHKFYTQAHFKVNPNDILFPFSSNIIQNNIKTTIWNPPHRNLDLFKIQHFDNGARTTSLKGLMVNFKRLNVQELPFKWDDEIQYKDIQEIQDYNFEDVDATYDLWEYTRKKIDLRIKLGKRYGIDFLNMPDASIGEKIIISMYCKRTGETEDQIRKRISFNSKIALHSCIHPLSKQLLMNTPFIDVVRRLGARDITPDSTRKKAKGEYKVNFHGVKVEFGLGGIHGSRSGWFKNGNGYRIRDIDVKSLYPNLAKALNISIKHLQHQVYLDIYDGEIIGVRMKEVSKPKEDQDTAIVAGYKLAANGAYGKSNSSYSLLYDPSYTMKTTLNGQFWVAALVYELMTRLKTATLLQINTDGVTIKVHESENDEYVRIYKEWEQKTGLSLEETEYSSMYIADVNNYGAMKIAENGKLLPKPKPKYKGRFEVELDENFLHKNRSFVIVRRALAKYFFEGVDPEKFMREEPEIFDFLGRSSFKGESYGHIGKKKVQKLCRYYVSTDGKAFIKTMNERKTRIGKGYVVTEANLLKTKDKPDNINYAFYLRRTWKEIRAINTGQTELFAI